MHPHLSQETEKNKVGLTEVLRQSFRTHNFSLFIIIIILQSIFTAKAPF
uniref:Uncharacterized protein n=1 Tax=Lepeophtheirus salmonis TaxID=72036 RepID=A0A0K2UWU2_LEPSM